MTASIVLFATASQIFLVAGQVLLKHAMNATNETPVPWQKAVVRFILGVGSLACWFFLWLGLLQKKDLSYIFPFEGMSPILILLGASVFLKERIRPRSWLGIALVSAGITLVSAS